MISNNLHENQQEIDDFDDDNEHMTTTRRLLELFQRQKGPSPLFHQSVLSSTSTYWFFRWEYRNVCRWVSDGGSSKRSAVYRLKTLERQRQIKKHVARQHLHRYEILQRARQLINGLVERPVVPNEHPAVRNILLNLSMMRQRLEQLQLLEQNNPYFKYWKCSLLSFDIPDFTPPLPDRLINILRLHMDMGQAFGQSTHLGELVLDPFLAVDDPMARCLLATGICSSKIHSLTIRCSNQEPTRIQHHQDSQHLAEMVSIILTDNKSLTKLELCAAVIGEDDMTTLSEGLCRNAYLINLVFNECDIGDGGVGLTILFRQGLQTNTSLTQLTVTECRVDDVGIQGLVEHWHPESPIQSLGLPNNSLGPTGAQWLFRAAQQHPALQTLDISGHGTIGFEALRNIGNDLPNQHYLTSINLFGCVDSRPFDLKWPLAAHRALLKGLYNNLHIQEINVSGNGFPPGREGEIEFYLCRNTSGGNILLSNRVSASLWCYFFQTCQFHDLGASLLFFYLREQSSLFVVA